MNSFICPYCLNSHSINLSTCEKYPDHEIPVDYKKQYEQQVPLWLTTIGFSSHGKTNYLANLVLTLENIQSAGPEWMDIFPQPLDTFTINSIKKWKSLLKMNSLPPATAKGQPMPYLIVMHNMPKTGSRCLAIYDTAGETFDSIETTRNQISSIFSHVVATWMFLSIVDFRNDSSGRDYYNLIDPYTKSIESRGLIFGIEL